jgi:hypothetical protein
MLTPEAIFQQFQRQVHLDFHTSPVIPDVAREFDAAAFARTFREACVNSVTVFAKCHHGMHYFPTRLGSPHPALNGRDLLGEQIEALHREGIRCPIYTTIGWEEDAAQRHPEWRQLRREGGFVEHRSGPNQPGAWKFLNFLHPDYQDYIEAHLREICERYGGAADGFFLDILSFAPGACWSEASRRFREAHGFTSGDAATQQRFEAAAQAAFAQRFTRLIHGMAPQATIFYNAGNDISVDSAVGPRVRYPLMTHAEIESLPSGIWGYHHFPRTARALAHWGKPWLGMTGRFQRMWGDFGGLKPRAALEYECFRAQALGGANSIGDQLHPRGALDPDTYALIGGVYAQCAAAEPFYAGSQAWPEFGNLSSSYPGVDPVESAKSEEGAMLMAHDMHRDVAMLDEQSDLTPFPLIQLPDSTVITPRLADKLRAYYESGGKLLLSYRAGFDEQGRWALGFLPLSFPPDIESTRFPTYWRATLEAIPSMGQADRVCYMPGLHVGMGAGVRTVVERVLPYFQRTDAVFCSHFQAPPMPEPDVHPAIVAGERFVYFADPVFREFRQTGNILMRDMWHHAMNALIGLPTCGAGLPVTIMVVPRRRGDDLIVTLLHYIPVRKSLEIDLIEEPSSFAGERLKLPAQAKEARLFGGEPLSRTADGSFLLPAIKGRLLIESPGFFA